MNPILAKFFFFSILNLLRYYFLNTFFQSFYKNVLYFTIYMWLILKFNQLLIIIFPSTPTAPAEISGDYLLIRSVSLAKSPFVFGHGQGLHGLLH